MRVALVTKLPRSEPVFGSVKTAVVKIFPLAISGRYFFFCSSVPPSLINSPAISALVPSDPAARKPLESSSVTTHIAILPIPKPP